MVNLLQPGSNFPGTLRTRRNPRDCRIGVLDREIPDPFDSDLDCGCDGAERDFPDRDLCGVLFGGDGRHAERSKPMLALIDDLGHIMLKVTGYVMCLRRLRLGGDHGDGVENGPACCGN